MGADRREVVGVRVNRLMTEAIIRRAYERIALIKRRLAVDRTSDDKLPEPSTERHKPTG